VERDPSPKIFNGDGIFTDTSLAVDYCKLAADQGDAIVQFSDGLCLLNGYGIPRDNSVAIHRLNLSADQGHKMTNRIHKTHL
jgi:TPR repeat protein